MKTQSSVSKFKVGDLVKTKNPLEGYEASIGIIIEYGKTAGSTKLWRVIWADRNGRASLSPESGLEVINERR